ncbi:MAG: hypothetical protein R3C01_16155, partial [Planctomycetaceae bacterium]
SVRYASADGSGLFLDDVVGKGGEGRRSLSRVTFIDAKGSTAVVSDALRESWSGSLVGSPELQKIDSQVRATPIPENLADWISRCAAAESRPEYLWRWCLYAVDLLTLPSVPREWRDEVLRLKVLLAMFNVLLDDLADLKSDPELLRELLQLASSSADDSATKGTRNVISQQVEASTTTGRHAGEEYRRLCFDVWDELTRSVQRLPRYAELKSAFQFDVSQLMTTIDYSQLLNGHPQLLNRADHDRFSPYGMMVMCAASIDLMVSTSVDAAEFGKIREVVAEGEWMARIGNLVSTWRRELPAGDITSGIFAEAVASGVITLSQLIDPTRSERNVRLIELAGIEQRYIRKWRQHRSRLHQLAESVTSCPLRLYAEAFDKLWMSEIASIGQK